MAILLPQTKLVFLTLQFHLISIRVILSPWHLRSTQRRPSLGSPRQPRLLHPHALCLQLPEHSTWTSCSEGKPSQCENQLPPATLTQRLRAHVSRGSTHTAGASQQRGQGLHGKHRASQGAARGSHTRQEMRARAAGGQRRTGRARSTHSRVPSAGPSNHSARGSKPGRVSTFLWPGLGKEYDLILEMIPPAVQV